MAVLGNGSKFAYSASSPVSWVNIGSIINFDQFIGYIRDKISTLVHSSSDLKPYMGGLFEIPDVELELEADLNQATAGTGVTQEALRTYLIANTTLWFRGEIPVNAAKTLFRGVEFQGFVLEWHPQPPIEDRQTISVKFCVSSLPAFYNAAASSIS